MQSEFIELANHLRQERLYLQSENGRLIALNKKVIANIEKVSHLAWIVREQRACLNGLILSHFAQDSASVFQMVNSIETSTFIESYKVIGCQDYSVSEFFQKLRESPQLVAACLVAGESLPYPSVIRTCISCIYGNCVLKQDEDYILQVLNYIMDYQLRGCERPRRVLGHGSCAFSKLFKLYVEGLHSAKLYLTAALHDPILHVLKEDDVFLEIDPSKAAFRFPSEERFLRFGHKGTPEYATNLQKYRTWTITKLVNLTEKFISGIKNNLYCFPSTLLWLIKQMKDVLGKSAEVEDACVDMLVSYFICPAIVNPEPYGITADTHISHIARFNLMQIAQILQSLALKKWQDIDPKLMDLYSRFDKESMSSLLALISEGESCGWMKTNSEFQGLHRTGVIITESDLKDLVKFIRAVHSSGPHPHVDHKLLDSIVSLLPSGQILQQPATRASPSHQSTTLTRKSILDKVQKVRARTVGASSEGNEEKTIQEEETLQVLVISLNHSQPEYVGFIPEHKVLNMNRLKLSSIPSQEEEEEGASITSGEKRTRFSLSHDEGSIGNTSDILEVVSEAASNHSVASSLDLENEDQNDNLSDMLSANVSGRGSPNVSGRDTPSSQITEGEAPPQERRQPTANKQSRADIEDKFGKFEIKPLIERFPGDETVSLVSDTWSTDVLASDSETIGEAPERIGAGDEGAIVRLDLPQPSLLDISEAVETNSEAWSTDVLASDSERMAEVDTDDANSLARSDDVRSEVEEACEVRRTEPEFANAGTSMSFNDRVKLGQNSSAFHPVASSSRPTVSFQEPLETGPSWCERKQVNESSVLEDFDPLLQRDSGVQQESAIPMSAMQSLGRLSLNLSDLPENGVVDINNSLLLNPSSNKVPSPSSTPVPSAEEGSQFSCPKVNGVDSNSESSETCKDTHGLAMTLSTVSIASTSSSGSGSETAPRTGAIPKSISFDKSADREVYDEDGKGKRPFFRGFKLPFKGRSRKGGARSQDDVFKPTPTCPVSGECEDILAKYRKKSTGAAEPIKIEEEETERTSDNFRHNASYAFMDAKRKLRHILSIADSYSLISGDNEVMSVLKCQLADAINIQDRTLVSQLHETLRCLSNFDEAGMRKIIKSLEEDYRNRSSYIAYLMRSRKGLLATVEYLKRLTLKLEQEKEVITRWMVTLLVGDFVKQVDTEMRRFTQEFRLLRVSDEKMQLTESFLNQLYQQLENHPTWASASEMQLELAQLAIERTVISQIFMHAFYPNGDADVQRDQILHEHMKKLSKIITPDHKDLRIPKVYQWECPWSPAQVELVLLGAHKTPRDKFQCILRCCKTIMPILEMANQKGNPAADDFVPVLVYVIIKANVPSLFSTIQFIGNFYEKRMEGEEHYWWTQFVAAVEFIKTMDY